MKFKCTFEVNGFTYEIKKGYIYELYEEIRIAKYKMLGNLGWQIPEAISECIHDGSLVIKINYLLKNQEQLNPNSRKILSKKFVAQLSKRPLIEDRATEKYFYYEKRRLKN